jgi:hypothetical protein
MTGRIYHTYSSVSVASPSCTLSSPSLPFARATSLIQLGDFSILFSLASVVLFPCLVLSLFPLFPFFFFAFFNLVYSVSIGTMV